jgi:hypothetical protein
MFEEPHGITTQNTTSYEVVILCPAQGSREVTLSYDRETLSDINAHGTQRVPKAAKRGASNTLKGP